MADEVWFFLVDKSSIDERESYAKTCLYTGENLTKQQRSRQIKAYKLTAEGAELSYDSLVLLHRAGKLDTDQYRVPPGKLEKPKERRSRDWNSLPPPAPTPIGAAYEIGRFVRSLGPEEINPLAEEERRQQVRLAEKAWRAK